MEYDLQIKGMSEADAEPCGARQEELNVLNKSHKNQMHKAEFIQKS